MIDLLALLITAGADQPSPPWLEREAVVAVPRLDEAGFQDRRAEGPFTTASGTDAERSDFQITGCSAVEFK